MLHESKKANQGYKLGRLIRLTLLIKENNQESSGLQRLITIGLNTTKNKLRNQVGRNLGDKMIVCMPNFEILLHSLDEFDNCILPLFMFSKIGWFLGIKIE